jgi:hypothetical protein
VVRPVFHYLRCAELPYRPGSEDGVTLFAVNNRRRNPEMSRSSPPLASRRSPAHERLCSKLPLLPSD